MRLRVSPSFGFSPGMEWRILRDRSADRSLRTKGGSAEYRAGVRMMIRRNIRLLNEGRYQPALAMFAGEAELTFPGDSTWS